MTPALAFPQGRKFDLACLGRLAVDLYAEQFGSRLEDARSVAKYSIMASTDFSTCTAMRLPFGNFKPSNKLAIMALARSKSRHV